MAIQATLLHGVVFELRFLESISHLLVAGETKLIATRKKIGRVLRRMRIVALYTSPIRNNFVRALRLLRYHLFVTLCADLAGVVR